MYREWDPPAEWRHAVACCWEQRVGPGGRVQRVLPDGHADVLVFDSGVVEVVGLHDEVALPLLPARTRLHGVRLRPAAVAAAFGTPAASLRNTTVAAADLLGARRARLLAEPGGIGAWIRSVAPDPRTVAAVRLLASRSVDDAAELLELTPRHLRRIMLADVGLGPKTFQRVVRLQRFVRAADRGAALAAAAAEAGYADQSHLTREVRALAGLTPAELVRERHPRP